MKNLTKSATGKFTEEDFNRLQATADKAGKSVSEWTREVLLAAVNGRGGTSIELALEALLAQSRAHQRMTADLLYAWSNKGRLTAERVKDLWDKHKILNLSDAEKLLGQAVAWRMRKSDTDEVDGQ